MIVIVHYFVKGKRVGPGEGRGWGGERVGKGMGWGV